GAQGNRETEDFRVSNDDAAGKEGNVAGRKKRRSKEAKLRNLLKYKAWLTRRSPIRGSSIE
ncbi:hypothetical protein Tco_1479984, partial [Tanacetum coccineum]